MESQKSPPKPIQLLINQIVRRYVDHRGSNKSNVELGQYEIEIDGKKRLNRKSFPSKLRDARSEVAQSLFLEFRSRRDQAFVDHFAQTFFGAKQYLSDEDQKTLADALIVQRRIDDVKTLTLMSLSANS